MEHHPIQTSGEFDKLVEWVAYNHYKKASVLINNGYVISFNEDEDFTIAMDMFDKPMREKIYEWINVFKVSSDEEQQQHLIFGKNNTSHIVGCEITDKLLTIFMEKEGQIVTQRWPNKYWIVAHKPFDDTWTPLQGELFYKYVKFYNNRKQWWTDREKYKNSECFSINDPKEAAMVLHGFTYYKEMKIDEVSVLFFDIETTGLVHDDTSKVLLISNTFVKNGVIERRLFAYDEYNTAQGLFDAWCEWVNHVSPSTISGHNIFGFDLPYLDYCAKKANTELTLGRNGSAIRFEKYVTQFRKDGSQSYDFNKAHIYGREIVDTMFLAYHFDYSRKYTSYGLKAIIEQEGLQRQGREFYNAATIKDNYTHPDEWNKIKRYAEHDADDAFALYKLMIPAYFYFCRSIPKSFQALNFSGTGSQLNALLIRSYFQHGHSLPKASKPKKFKGGISVGVPGIYDNCWKIDVNSLYPSVILQYSIFDKEKDPCSNFLKMVEYFTHERLENKKKAATTGSRYFKELEQSEKLAVNSAFGLCGAIGLLFNSPECAELITLHGRELLKETILWATGEPYIEKEDGDDDEHPT